MTAAGCYAALAKLRSGYRRRPNVLEGLGAHSSNSCGYRNGSEKSLFSSFGKGPFFRKQGSFASKTASLT